MSNVVDGAGCFVLRSFLYSYQDQRRKPIPTPISITENLQYLFFIHLPSEDDMNAVYAHKSPPLYI